MRLRRRGTQMTTRSAPSARAKRARKVLALDANALDGYVILAQAIEQPSERLALLFEAVRRGRRQWADAIKRPSSHDFWLDFETRPFMRALHLLALALWEHGERVEAIAEAESLLRLNANDNQGIRELLWAWYPVVGDWAAMEKLLKRYRKDWSVAFLYARWLVAFRRGEVDAALLAEALEVNPHVPGFLADPDKPIEQDEDETVFAGYVLSGSVNEAAGYAELMHEGWQAVPGAIERLLADVRQLASGEPR